MRVVFIYTYILCSYNTVYIYKFSSSTIRSVVWREREGFEFWSKGGVRMDPQTRVYLRSAL